MIAMIGATGTTGSAVLDRLAGCDVPVRALVRPGSAADRPRVLPGRVEVVSGDAADPRALAATLDGADAVVLAMGNGPRQREIELAAVAAAARAGTGHLVKVSAPVVGATVPVAVARLHHEVEQAVVAAGVPHTFLRPYAFLQNLLRHAPAIRATGAFAGCTAGAPLNMVDVRDVADVAVVALRRAGPLGALPALTGPEAVSYPEVARRLSALGSPVRHVDLPAPRLRAELGRAGLPRWLVEHLVEIQLMARDRPERPNDTVERITGRPPRGLDAFLREHAGAFRRRDLRLSG